MSIQITPGQGRCPTGSLFDGRLWRILRWEEGFRHVQHTRLMNMPGPFHVIGISQSDEAAFVMCEIKVVSTEGLLNPRRDPDEAGSVDVGADSLVKRGMDNRILSESSGLHRGSIQSSSLRTEIFNTDL